MKLRTRTHLSGLLLVVAIALATSSSAVLTIDRLSSDLNHKLLSLELKTAEERITRAITVLTLNGLDGVLEYVDRAKRDLLQEFAEATTRNFGTMRILTSDLRQILPDGGGSQIKVPEDCKERLASMPGGLPECPINDVPCVMHFKAVPEWNWILVVSATESDLNRTRDDFIVSALIIFGVVSLLGLALFLRMSKVVVDPILRLSRTAKEIGEGHWDNIPKPTERKDELGMLENSFSNMATKLHEAHLELEHKAKSLRTINDQLSAEIEERSKAEMDLRLANESFGSILDSMPSIVIGVDRQCKVTHWNEGAHEATGVPADEVLGQPLEDAMPRLGDRLDTIIESIEDGTPRRLHKQVFRQDGHNRMEDILIFPLSSVSAGAVIRLEDVTHRVRLEEMMVQTEKMMSVGGLAAGMAHELNNPLAGVLSGTQNLIRRLDPCEKANENVLADTGCPPEALEDYLAKRGIQRILESIRSAGIRASEIIRSMLEFSRNSSGSRQMMDIRTLLDASVELARTEYDQAKDFDFRNVAISREYDPDLSPVFCVPSELEQVVLNLLRNAAQAMEHHDTGDSQPTIILRAKAKDGGVSIEIQDNGPGIPESIRKRIFEPFFTTKPVGLGTGLGLSVSYFIITENHGGSISADTPPEGGTVFRIHLPSTSAPPENGNA